MSLALGLQHASMLGAARGRLASLRIRLGQSAVFATGAVLTLNSWIPIAWLIGMAVAMLADYALGSAYLKAKTERARRFYRLSFVIGCAATISVFAAMALYLAMAGGPAGQLLGMLMLASSLVSVMLFLFQAPVFMLITAAPCTICLLILPWLPAHPSPAGALESSAGVAFGIGAFLFYVARSAINNGRMFGRLEDANAVARERAEEAEAKRAEAEAANSAKSEFLTTMTHELRTPLNAVIGYAEIIEEDSRAECRSEAAGDAQRIIGSARHLLGLIDQILQFSTMESMSTRAAGARFDVRLAIEEVVGLFEPQARAAGNRLVCRVAPDLGQAETDMEKLALCVTHLVSNAVKFTADGLVSVSVEREPRAGGDWLRIAVSDTGCGMSAEDIDKAFQPFTQIDGSSTRSKGGMGLGLTLVQAAARVLGGEIGAVSEPGRGSTFILRVPMRLKAGMRKLAA